MTEQQIEQICFLRDYLDKLDNDPYRSMTYYTTALKTTTPSNCPHSLIKEVLITETLYTHCHDIMNSRDCAIVDKELSKIIGELNYWYDNKQHYCWRSHDHHFHTGFMSYVNCPITCLAEIVEFLTKMIKEQN